MPEIELTHDEIVSFDMLQEAGARAQAEIGSIKQQAEQIQNRHNAMVHAYYAGLAKRRGVEVQGLPANVSRKGESITLTWDDPAE